MHCGYMSLLIPRRLIDWFGHCEAALQRAENFSNARSLQETSTIFCSASCNTRCTITYWEKIFKNKIKYYNIEDNMSPKFKI